MTTRFKVREINAAEVATLTAGGVLPAVARVLNARGIHGADDIAFEWKALLPPALLPGIEKAAEILVQARDAKKHVTVIGDYDCDGATATAIAVRGLRAMGIDCSYFVPDRFRFGYGLSASVAEHVATLNPKPAILLTVDNGITSVEGVKRAAELGIDVIVTDHHLQGEALPEASAIVNPVLGTTDVSRSALAGCGVIYYLLLVLRSLLRKNGVYTQETQPRLDIYADLVALGTVADVVALNKNNRILVSQGLKRIRRGAALAGINALFSVAKRDYSTATTHELAFSLAPRVNSAGRISRIDTAIECLLTDDTARATALATALDSSNEERKALEDAMLLEAVEKVKTMDYKAKTALTLYGDTWHQGIAGLTASRIKEKINRPTIVFAPDTQEGTALLKGSGRSITGVHLKDILDTIDKEYPDLIVQHGGHALAAGLSIPKEKLEAFAEAFDAVTRRGTTQSSFEIEMPVDGPLDADEITFDLVNALAIHPWGQNFEAPTFANEFLVTEQRLIKNAHLKLTLELQGRKFEAIYFRHTVPLPSKVRLAYQPKINSYMGRNTIQLTIAAIEDN